MGRGEIQMGEIKWIRIATDLFANEKILLIEGREDRDKILAIWIKLLCFGGRLNDDGFFRIHGEPYTEEMFAEIFRRPVEDVRSAFQVFRRFGMIDDDEDGTVYIPNWEKHQNIDGMARVRELNAKRNVKYRQRKKAKQSDVSNDVSETSRMTSRDAIDIEIDIDNKREKDKKEKASRDTSRYFSDPEVDSLFVVYIKQRKLSHEAVPAVRQRLINVATENGAKKFEPAYAALIVQKAIAGKWNDFYPVKSRSTVNGFHNMFERTDDLDAYAQEEMRRKLNGMDI